jgi:hypothetical protein
MAKVQLLNDVLLALVRHWGYERVLQSLQQLDLNLLNEEERKILSRPTKKRSISAVDVVASDNPRDTNLVDLMKQFAADYDRKDILPSIGDVRNFFSMSGFREHEFKDRIGAFRKLYSEMRDLPSDQIRDLVDSARFSGPAKLGPISEAIKSSSDARRSSKELPSHNLNEDSTGSSKSEQK